MRGTFIVFEGPDGSGKSTQARALAERLQAGGVRVLLTREPGGTEIGERLRGIVLDIANATMRPTTEALVYSAARAQLVEDVIRPALELGTCVVCDRFSASTLAYQGGGRGLDRAQLTELQRFTTGGLEPDIQLLLDLPVEQGLRRRYAEGAVNRLDSADLEFHRRVRDFYLKLAAEDPEGWRVVDATGDPDAIATSIGACIVDWLRAHG